MKVQVRLSQEAMEDLYERLERARRAATVRVPRQALVVLLGDRARLHSYAEMMGDLEDISDPPPPKEIST